jgi:hypothetical protein
MLARDEPRDGLLTESLFRQQISVKSPFHHVFLYHTTAFVSPLTTSKEDRRSGSFFLLKSNGACCRKSMIRVSGHSAFLHIWNGIRGYLRAQKEEVSLT